MGAPQGEDNVLVRVHSECLTGDVFGSLKCDCGSQLDAAMRRIAGAGRGAGVGRGRGVGGGGGAGGVGGRGGGRGEGGSAPPTSPRRTPCRTVGSTLSTPTSPSG